MLRRFFIALLATVVSAPAATAGQTQSAHPAVTAVQAVRATTSVAIDGRLDDEVWLRAPAASQFTQRDPDEGKPVSELTELRIAFDDLALYVGVRLYDREPSRIARQLSRRDSDAEADSFTLYLDPHHDHLTGAAFSVTAAGVQGDSTIYNDSAQDNAWDAVWESAVKIDETGLDSGDASALLPASLSPSGASHLRHQCDAVHPAQERTRVARARSEE